MAKDVEHAITNLAIQFGGRASEESAKEWYKALRSSGHYLEDVW